MIKVKKFINKLRLKYHTYMSNLFRKKAYKHYAAAYNLKKESRKKSESV